MIDELAHPGAARRRSAASRRSTATQLVDVLRRASAGWPPSGPTCVSVDVNPLIVDADGVPVAVDALVELGDAADGSSPRAVRPRPTRRAVPRPVRAARRASSPARRRHPGKFGFVVAAQHARQRLRGRGLRHQPRGRGGARHRRPSPTSPTSPTARSTSSFVCTPAAANPDLLRACAAKGITRRVRHRRPATARPATTGAPAEAELVALCRRARHPARRAQRPGRGVSTPVDAVRPDRRPVPAGRAHRRRQPERQLRVAASSTTPAPTGRRHQPGGVGRQRRRRHGRPTTSTSTPTTRPPPSAWPTSRASPTAGRFSTRSPRRPRASRSCWSRAAPPRAGRGRRPATPARSPPTTRSSTAPAAQAGVTRAATVEEAFEAAATFATQPLPAGPERRRADHGRRLGRGHRRRHHPRPRPRSCSRCPTTCAPPSTRSCRPAGAATTRSTAPAARPATPSPR